MLQLLLQGLFFPTGDETVEKTKQRGKKKVSDESAQGAALLNQLLPMTERLTTTKRHFDAEQIMPSKATSSFLKLLLCRQNGSFCLGKDPVWSI